ncbi:hypothetical protein [Brevibacillus dissolubilis]|uniref:hypothetical protein n=1 Tax=Brevibacillus dissolubilis TaxID=1844116 RepID=UPI001116E314|nr:hypothetical protein [Brevibacillus dissolubilis]
MSNLKKPLVLGLVISLATLLGGCTYESGPKLFASDTKEAQEVTSPEENLQPAAPGEAKEALIKAIKDHKTNPKHQKFWYDGYVKNTILSRTTTSMFNGVVVNPDGYLVNGRIATQDYQYYRNKDKRYVRKGDYWITAKEEPLELDVTRGFEDWLPFLDQASVLPEEKVIGTICTPYQIKISGTDWLANSTSPLFEPLRQELAGRSDLQSILKETTVKMTFWIGTDGLIHQYQTWIIVPIPGAGYMDQEVNFRMFKFTDESIALPDVAEVEKYLLD